MKRILIILSLLLPLFSARAQYVTYNHDETKMYQVTVMETGVGNLTPRAFYSVVHNRYYQNAAETNKLRYRSEAAAHGSVQVGISETIDTSLTKRAEVEALNMADRQVDLAWQAEGPKIQSRLEAFNRNIERLSEAGGNAGDITLWQERYHLFQTAVSSIRNAYMPNAERKKQYLAIYDDITRKNETLIAYIVSVDARERAKERLAATVTLPHRNGEIASEASGRWKELSNKTTD
jgi:hypothetical protein